MRFIHTADWHLGRLFHGVHLTEDQAFALDQFVDVVRDAKVGAVVIAGDLFDRAVPPPEAVELFDDVLSRLALDLKVAVIVIAGNHDSPQRVNYGARIFRAQNAHIFGNPTREPSPVELADEWGPVRFYALPYAEPPVIRECFADQSIIDHDSAMRRCIEEIRASQSSGQRSVLVAHGFVAGGTGCDSERPLSVGGASTVDASRFAAFDYVALGHLHGRQSLCDGRVHYSGSLLKYSFSEAGHEKSINIVDMNARGQCRIERIALKPRRDVRCVRGKLAEILVGPHLGENAEDYLQVILDDEGALLDPMGRLREVYPNVLAIELPSLNARPTADAGRIDRKKMSEVDLFAAFFSQVTGEQLTDEQSEVFASVVNAVRKTEREGVA